MLRVILRLRRTSLYLSLPFHGDGIIPLRTGLSNRGSNFSIHLKSEHDLNFVRLIAEITKLGDNSLSRITALIECFIEVYFSLHFFKHTPETACTHSPSSRLWLIALSQKNTAAIQWKLY